MIINKLSSIARQALMPWFQPTETAVSFIDEQTPKFALESLKLPIGIELGREAAQKLNEANVAMLELKLADMLCQPIRYMNIRECYGRVYLVDFEPLGAIDPILPLAAVALGPTHDKAWRMLALQIQSFNDTVHYPTWWKDSKQFAIIAANEAIKILTPDEANYYILKLFQVITKPMEAK